MADKWYVRRGDKVRGPIAADAITRLIVDKKLRGDDEVSRDGKRWRPLRDVAALMPAAKNGAAAREEPDPLLQKAREDAAIAARMREDRRRAQRRADDKERTAVRSGPRVRAWHYLVVLVLAGAVAGLLFIVPANEEIAEPDCAAPAAPGIIWRDCRRPGAQLANQDLSGAVLRGANLIGAVLRASNLSGADVAYANLSGANLRAANLAMADLTGATLQRADLSHAKLTGAKLAYADLTGAELQGVDLEGAILDHAILSEDVICLPGSVGECIPGRR